MTTSRTKQQVTGDGAEAAAVALLEGAGLKVLGRNVKVGNDELDVICVDDKDVMVFVEVRRRTTRADALESIGKSKQNRIVRAATRFLGPEVHRRFMRFDVVVVSPNGIEHVVDAFRPLSR